MSDFTSYPRENQFSTQIIGELLESATAPFVLNVKKAPTFSLASGTFYAIVEPGTSREEGLIISAISGTQWTVSQRGLPTAEGGVSTLTSHGGGSKIIITNNWQVFSDIASSLATKMDKSGGTFTGRTQYSGNNAAPNVPSFADETARDAAMTSPLDGDLCTVAGDLYHYNGSTVQWEIADTGTPTPNATTSVTGKLRRATEAQFISETDEDGGEPLAPQPSQIKKNLTWTKDLTFGATINAYDPVYNDSADAKWKHADADGSGTYDVSTLGIALDSGVDTDTGKRVAMPGSVITGMSGLSAGIVYLTDRSSISATTIAFVDSNPDTITDSGNGFVSAGFKSGDTIRVSGSGSNDGVYTIDTVAAGTITLIAGDTLVAEVAGASVTITSMYGTTAGTNQTILGYAPNSTTLYFNPRVFIDTQARNLIDGNDANTRHIHEIVQNLELTQRILVEINDGSKYEAGSGTESITNYGGIYDFDTGANTGNHVAIGCDSNTGLFGGSFHDKSPRFWTAARFGDTTDQEAIIGMSVANSVMHNAEVLTTNHAAFLIHDGSIFASVSDGTQAKSSALTGITLTDRNIYYIEESGGNYLFYVNGTLKHTSSGNEPTTLYSGLVGLETTTTATKTAGVASPKLSFTI